MKGKKMNGKKMNDLLALPKKAPPLQSRAYDPIRKLRLLLKLANSDRTALPGGGSRLDILRRPCTYCMAYRRRENYMCRPCRKPDGTPCPFSVAEGEISCAQQSPMQKLYTSFPDAEYKKVLRATIKWARQCLKDAGEGHWSERFTLKQLYDVGKFE